MTVTVKVELTDIHVAALAAINATLGSYGREANATDREKSAHVVGIIAQSCLVRPLQAIADAYLAGNHDLREWAGAEPAQNDTGTEREQE